MVAGRPELVQAVQILVWPVGFLSNVFASPASMPGWLGTVVEWNPMSATATAVRELFGNPGGATAPGPPNTPNSSRSSGRWRSSRCSSRWRWGSSRG